MASEDQTPVDDGHEMVLAHVLFVDIVGYSREITPEQANWLEALVKIAQGCPTYQAAQKEHRVIAAPAGDGYALAFLESIDDAVRCGEELIAAVVKQGVFRVRAATHFGPVEEVFDISGSPNVSGEGINMAARALEFAEPGVIYATERSYELVREVPAYADRFEKVGDKTTKHSTPITIYKLLDAKHKAHYSERDFDKAKRIHERESKRRGWAVAPIPKIAERLAHIRYHLILGLVLFLVVEMIHHIADGTDFGTRMRLWAYDRLQPNMPKPEGRLPIVVADLKDNFADLSDLDRRTDRQKLAELLKSVADHYEATGQGPLAIGIDIEFGLQRTPTDEVPDERPAGTSEVVKQALRLAQAKPRPIPVFLAVYEGLPLGANTLLGDEAAKSLMVHAAVPMVGKSGLSTLYDGIEIDGELYPSVVGALAQAYFKEFGEPKKLPDFLMTSRGEPFELSAPKINSATYFVNYGALDELVTGTVSLDDPAAPSRSSVAQELNQRVVLIGRSTDAADLHSIPNRENLYPGVYLHALGLYSRVQSPVGEFQPWLATTLALTASLFVLILTSAVRRMYAWAAPEVDDRKLRIWTTLGLIGLTLWGSVALIRHFGVLWTDYLLVALALAGDPVLEQWIHSAAVGGYQWSRQAWHRLVFKSGD